MTVRLGALSVVIICLTCSYCAPERESRVILFSFDGFRHDYLDLAKVEGRNISAFKEIIKKGFRARVKPVTPSITFPAHFSIATGRYVENHGLMLNRYYLPDFNATFNYKSSTDAVDPKWWNYNSNEPIWITNERHPGKRSCVIFWPGSEAAYQGRRPYKTLGKYDRSVTFKRRVQQVIDWMRADETITLCAVYMNEPDSTGHRFGPNSQEVLNKVEEMNDVVALLLEQLETSPALRDSVNVVIVSDHGMSKTSHLKEIRVYDILSPNDYILNESPVFTGIWPKQGGPSAIELHRRLKGADLPGLTIYKKDEIPSEYHYANTPRCPPIILVADHEHVILSYPEQHYSNGEHGYPNQIREMHPFLIAFGPDVQKVNSIEEVQQVDIYPLICGLLGLEEPNKIDGNLKRVLPFLRYQPTLEFVERFSYFARDALESISSPSSRVVLRAGAAVFHMLLYYCVQ